MVLRIACEHFTSRSSTIRTWLLLLSLGVLLTAPAAAEIGRVKSTMGVATVERGADKLPAATGQQLMPGDWLETGKDGRMSVTFADNTRFAVGPDSRIELTKFDYDPTTEQGAFVAKVERGSIAAVSGRITKTRCGGQAGSAATCGMQIETPDSVLDVRGTRFIITVPR
jgi:hypothetical protein